MRFLFFIILFCGGTLFADKPLPQIAPIKDPSLLVDNEITRLNSLILATEQSLEAQKKLKSALIEYNKLQELHFKNPQNNDILLRMAKSGHRALTLIKNYNLVQTFDADFINELTVFSQAAAKRGIPKP